jgi:hypothetical protein
MPRLMLIAVALLTLVACGPRKPVREPSPVDERRAANPLQTLDVDGAELDAFMQRHLAGYKGLTALRQCGVDSYQFRLVTATNGCPEAGAMSQEVCGQLTENCAVIGRAMFCDAPFLQQLRVIGSIAVSDSWSRLISGPKRGDHRAVFTSPTATSFIGLAAVLHTQRSGVARGEYLRNNLSKDEIFDFGTSALLADELFGASPLLEFAQHAAVATVISHELAHLEQNACGVVKLPSDQAASWRAVYGEATCGKYLIQDPELEADLRSIELLQNALARRVTEMEATPLAQQGTALAEELDRARAYAPQIAGLALLYALEYNTLVDPAPESAIALLRNAPRSSTAEFMEYFVEAAAQRGMRASLHLDPAVRGVFIARALRVGQTMSAVPGVIYRPYRLAAVLGGRWFALQAAGCGPVTQQQGEPLARYVMESIKPGATAGR